MRLLVVEDDPHIASGLIAALRRSGHAVDGLASGRDADAALIAQTYDLVILDLGLPHMDGPMVLANLRARKNHTPVLILTARDELSERVRGLNAGADDYMVKPFEFEELLARIHAISRRAQGSGSDDVQVGKLSYSVRERRVTVDGLLTELAPRELGVLEVLLQRRGKVVSKHQLMEALCDWNEDLTETAIEVYLHRVRKKLEGSEVNIRTVRGFGYLLEVPGSSP